jgi:hypothetical protein
MKDELPFGDPFENECGIINLENSNRSGSHWTAWYKTNNEKFYFDSYGDAKPPLELVNYLGKDNLFYNARRVQDFDDPPVCGHLCLLVLKRLMNNELFVDVVETLDVQDAIRLVR